MGVAEDTRCDICHNERDCIEHIFWKCDCIRRFSNRLETLFNLLRDKCQTVFNVHFTENLALFGVDNCMKLDSVFDCIVLQAKQCIYKCRVDKRLSTFSSFVHQVTLRYKIEEYNAQINCEISKFNLNWLFFKCIVQEQHHILNLFATKKRMIDNNNN